MNQDYSSFFYNMVLMTYFKGTNYDYINDSGTNTLYRKMVNEGNWGSIPTCFGLATKHANRKN